MIEKVLEAFFRHVVLILLPVVLIPLLGVAAVLATPPQYEASAGMWVEQATYLNYSTDDINRYLPPAQNQQSRLVELMATKSFRSEIAAKTALAPLTVVAGGDVALEQLFARDFEVTVSGDHLLTLRFRAEDRAVAIDVLDTMVGAFKARATADRYGQAQVAITFYQSRLMEAEDELAAARTALAKYLAENPSVAATLTRSGIEAARLDQVFAERQRRVEASQRDADLARTSLERAELDVSAGVQGLDFGFRLVDSVEASSTPSRLGKKVLTYPLVALVIGVVMGASLLLLFALSDHSVRSLADLGPEVVLLGALPRLRAMGLARRPGPDVIRRAVGFVAGAPMRLRGSPGTRVS